MVRTDSVAETAETMAAPLRSSVVGGLLSVNFIVATMLVAGVAVTVTITASLYDATCDEVTGDILSDYEASAEDLRKWVREKVSDVMVSGVEEKADAARHGLIDGFTILGRTGKQLRLAVNFTADATYGTMESLLRSHTGLLLAFPGTTRANYVALASNDGERVFGFMEGADTGWGVPAEVSCIYSDDASSEVTVRSFRPASSSVGPAGRILTSDAAFIDTTLGSSGQRLEMTFAGPALTLFSQVAHPISGHVIAVVHAVPLSYFAEVLQLSLVASSEVLYIVDREQGFLVAASHGPTPGSFIPDTAAPHSTIQQLAAGIQSAGGYQGFNATVLSIVPEGAVDPVPHLVAVHRFFITGGVDWWLVTAVSEVSYLVDVLGKKVENLDRLRKDADRLQDESTPALVGIVSAVAFFVMCSSIGVVAVALSPFRRLEHEMKEVAEMNIDLASEGSLSLLTEVRNLQVSFWKMKQNLVEFRAYMPSSLLEESEADKIEPPSGVVIVVFTDIKSSTMLWNRSATAMNKAIELHNEIIREKCQLHSGYEVKTIGDSFMISFSEPLDAVNFSLSVLEALSQEEWPAELALGSEGLQVRIGAHVGPVILEENPLTGRTDYRGTPVNTAARVEGRAPPGTLCMTTELHDQIKSASGLVGQPSTTVITEVTLKGLSGTFDLFVMKPKICSLENNSNRSDSVEALSHRKTSIRRSFYVSADVKPQLQIQKKTGLSVMHTEATVAVVRAELRSESETFDRLNSTIGLAAGLAAQTEGTIQTVCGRLVVVTWNTSKSCDEPVSAALRFTACFKKPGGSLVRIGLGYGTLQHGNVGTEKTRFHTIHGMPFEAALSVVGLTANYGTFALLADCNQTNRLSTLTALSPFLRKVDVWIDAGTRKKMALLEVRCAQLLEKLEETWLREESTDDAAPYESAFHNALRGHGVEELERIRRLFAPRDTVIATVISNFKARHRKEVQECLQVVRFDMMPTLLKEMPPQEEQHLPASPSPPEPPVICFEEMTWEAPTATTNNVLKMSDDNNASSALNSF